VEGRSVAAILDRCRSEAFPFAAEHALMIASRAASALEFLHGKKSEAGSGLFHGLLAPSRVVVAFDGEVKLKGLGLWPALRETGLLPAEERRYLAPEQAAGGPGDARSDGYALGLVLLEALTGSLPQGDDILAALPAARVTSTTGEQGPLPKPLVELLRRALGPEPSSRFPGMAEMRRAIDTLLFSGDFTPTTFDVAFFMHTLFRDDMEREARAVEEARRADYRDLLPEEKPGPADPPAPAARATEDAAEPAPEPAPPAVSDRLPSVPPPAPDASGSRPRSPRDAAREAAARMTLGQAPPPASRERRGVWLALGLLGAVVVGGGAGWLYSVIGGLSASPAPNAAPPPAAEARVRELEARIAQLEREKQEAEARAADEARQDLEARARAGGATADPAAIERAQAEARRRARAEQETRQQEELRRIEDEKRAEEARLAEASPTPAPTTAPSPSPSPEPAAGSGGEGEAASAGDAAPPPAAPAGAEAAPPAPSPPVQRGTLVDVTDPAVTAPVLVRDVKPTFPEIARVARATGVVELRALVDENGSVRDVAVVRSSRPGVRFEIEAERAVRLFKYRPATQGGVAVKTWVRVRVNFGGTE
jgi:TonB family protein